MNRTIEFRVELGDITRFESDVVALKYAQDFYGATKRVVSLLNQEQIFIERLKPVDGDYRLVDSNGSIRSKKVLFVGVPELYRFGYQEIRDFSVKVLEILSTEEFGIKHLAMTIHGVGYGLDEVEVFLSQLAGCIEAIKRDSFPKLLETITIVEQDEERVRRLRLALDRNLDKMDYVHKLRTGWAYEIRRRSESVVDQLEGVGRQSESKPHVFVAMPFRKDMDDVFYFGIQPPVHSLGFLCERIDQESFTGDILVQIKRKIEKATVVIADLTGANPNVYLEVGYAWGQNRPTILVVKDAKELKFDVSGQRCLSYERIFDLQAALTKELNSLAQKKFNLD